jgi:hypothetical protein
LYSGNRERGFENKNQTSEDNFFYSSMCKINQRKPAVLLRDRGSMKLEECCKLHVIVWNPFACYWAPRLKRMRKETVTATWARETREMFLVLGVTLDT